MISMAKRKTRTTGLDADLPDSAGTGGHGEREDDPFSQAGVSAEPAKKSRSQKKRESTWLQHRGEELAALAPAIQKQLPLTPDLAEALVLWRGLKSREAKRRHMQYIGRLIRELDNQEKLLSALEHLGKR